MKNAWYGTENRAFLVVGFEKFKIWGGMNTNTSILRQPPVLSDFERADRFAADAGIISDNDGEILVFRSESSYCGICIKGDVLSLVLHLASGRHDWEPCEFSELNLELLKSYYCFSIYFSESHLVLVDSANEFPEYFAEIPFTSGWYDVFRENYDESELFGIVECFKIIPSIKMRNY